MNIIPASRTTTVEASHSKRTWKIEQDVNVTISSQLAIDASGEYTKRAFVILGTLKSEDYSVAMIVGDKDVADSNTSIRIDKTDTGAGSLISAGKGILALGGGVSFLNLGTFKTVNSGLDFRGSYNTIENDASMISTRGSAIGSRGLADLITNNGTLRAYDHAIVSSGGSVRIVNNGTLKSTHDEGVVSSGGSARITDNGSIVAKLDGILSSGASARIAVTGTVTSSARAAIETKGDGATIVNRGTLDGHTFGILSSGDDVAIRNNSVVSASGTGIKLAGDDAVLKTTAHLSGKTALLVAGDDARITNTSEIDGIGKEAAAIRITSTDATTLTNTGHIDAASGIAIQAGGGSEKIVNTGSIIGDVLLGGGNDVFSALRGEVDGKVHGGRGNDTYIVGIDLKIVEKAGEGIDTVRSKYTWTLGANIENLELTGSGNMDATGNRLDNTLAGNRGNNHLTGGSGADTFVFADRFGQDIITDFEDRKDHIDFSDFSAVSKYSDIAAHMRQVGDDVVIRFNAHATLTIEDVDKAHLTAADFIF